MAVLYTIGALLAMVQPIAVKYNVPTAFVMAIIQQENAQYNATAIHVNKDGSWDMGMMQLNNSWFNDPRWADPVVNIEAGVKLIREIKDMGYNWWQVAIIYNCGIGTFTKRGPPSASLDYASRVIESCPTVTGWH